MRIMKMSGYIGQCKSIVCIIVLCFSFNVAHAAYLNEGASQLREVALSRLNAFQSLECTYIYYSDIAKNKKKVPSRVIFKTRDKLIFHDRTYILDGVADVVQQRCAETNVNGKIDWLLVDERTAVNTNLEKFQFLGYNSVSPLLLTGYNSAVTFHDFEENTLLDFLREENDFYALEREGQRTLNVFTVPKNGDYEMTVMYGLILYFDDADYITRIDTVVWPACTAQEFQYYKGDMPFYNLFEMVSTDTFLNWQVVDDINMPLMVERTVWNYDLKSKARVDAVRPSYAQFENKQISVCEHTINLKKVIIEKLSPPSIQEEYRIEIDPETVKINNPNLTDDDFQLKYDNVNVVWNRETGDYDDDVFGKGNSIEDQKNDAAEYLKRYDDAVSPDWIFLISVALGLASVSLLLWVIFMKMKAKP